MFVKYLDEPMNNFFYGKASYEEQKGFLTVPYIFFHTNLRKTNFCIAGANTHDIPEDRYTFKMDPKKNIPTT